MASSAAILSRVEMCTEHLVNCPLNGFHNVFNLMCTEKWPLNEAGEGGVYNLELNFDRLAAEQQGSAAAYLLRRFSRFSRRLLASPSSIDYDTIHPTRCSPIGTFLMMERGM